MADLKNFTDKEIVNELFKRLGEPIKNTNNLGNNEEEYILGEHSNNPKIIGYSYFYGVFEFNGDDIKSIGFYE